MRVIFCLSVVKMTKVVRKVPHFGAGVVWGMISSGFPVFWIDVPGCFRNGYGTSPSLWVQKKLVNLWQATQDTWLCSAEFFWEFLSYSAFNLLRNLGIVILSLFRIKCVLRSTVCDAFRCFSRSCCYFSFLFLTLPWDLGKSFVSKEDCLPSLSLINSDDLLLLWGKEFQ